MQKEIEKILCNLILFFNFICGALAFCDTEEARRKLINEIKAKNITKYGDAVEVITEIRKGNI